MMAGKKWEVSDWLNFDSMKRKMRDTMEGAVTKAEVRDLFVADRTLAKLNQRITTGMGRIKLDLFVGDPKLAGKSMEEQFHAAEQIVAAAGTGGQAVKQAYQDQQDALARSKAAKADHRQHGGPEGRCGGAWQATKIGANMLTGVFGTTGKAELEVAAKSFREINETILQMRSHPFQIDAKGMEDLMKKVQDLKKNMPWSMDLNTSSTEANLKSLKEMFDYAERVRGIQQKFPNLDQQIQKSNQGMDRLEQSFPDASKGVQDVTNKFSQTQSAIDGLTLAGFISQIEAATAAMQELAATPPACRLPAAAAASMTAAHGGMAFLAGGGRPRGTDVIPAMLSPGEMVMSAAHDPPVRLAAYGDERRGKALLPQPGRARHQHRRHQRDRRGRRHGAANGPLDCHGTAT